MSTLSDQMSVLTIP